MYINENEYNELTDAKKYLDKVTSIVNWFEIYIVENWVNEDDWSDERVVEEYNKISQLLTSYSLGYNYNEGIKEFNQYIKELEEVYKNNKRNNYQNVKVGDKVFIEYIDFKDINKVDTVVELLDTSFKTLSGLYVEYNMPGCDKYYNLIKAQSLLDDLK